MYGIVTISTGSGNWLTDIVRKSGVQSGICCVVIPHTTAAVTINSQADPNTLLDIVDDVRRLVPTRVDFHHVVDPPSDAAAHVKASLIGNTESVLIEDGDLVLGTFQSLLFFDFDRPRERRAMIKIIEG
jgi:secondary thiamine-phosphate synthase enzyme